MEGSKSMKDTIAMCLEYAWTLTGPVSKAYVKDAWAKHYAQVPTTIELLHPTLKLSFEFFSDVHNDVLRIGTTGDRTAHGTCPNALSSTVTIRLSRPRDPAGSRPTPY